jgi:hypothetical protein
VRFRSSPHCRYPNLITTSEFNGSVVFLDIRAQINFDRFLLFCIFVRNDISVTVIGLINVVDIFSDHTVFEVR